MAERRIEVATALRPGCVVSWRVGPVDTADTLRTGRLQEVRGEQARVRPNDALGDVWVPVADLDGMHRQPPIVRRVPDLPPALDLPAPVAQTLELLGLLDRGVEIQPGQHTVLRPVLEQLVQRGYLVDRGAGRWELTARGREVSRG